MARVQRQMLGHPSKGKLQAPNWNHWTETSSRFWTFFSSGQFKDKVDYVYLWQSNDGKLRTTSFDWGAHHCEAPGFRDVADPWCTRVLQTRLWCDLSAAWLAWEWCDSNRPQPSKFQILSRPLQVSLWWESWNIHKACRNHCSIKSVQ